MSNEKPEDILKHRLASGEIDIEEYERLKATLREQIVNTNDDFEQSPGNFTSHGKMKNLLKWANAAFYIGLTMCILIFVWRVIAGFGGQHAIIVEKTQNAYLFFIILFGVGMLIRIVVYFMSKGTSTKNE